MNNNVTIFIDGACQPNPGAGGIGIYLIVNEKEEKISKSLSGTVTNNIAEYQALIESLKLILDKNITSMKSQTHLHDIHIFFP